MNIKSILEANGVETEKIETIVNAVNLEIPKSFVAKTQYNKKAGIVDELNNKIADLEAKLSSDTTQKELTRITQEYEAYKQKIEAEKSNASKIDALKNQLKEAGANEKIISLLTKEFDLDKIELENGKVKGWDELVKPVKETYVDFFATEQAQGTPPATPPNGNQTNAGEPKKEPYVPPIII